jgi:hypothetical protein
MIFVIAFGLLALVYLGIVLWERRVLRDRKRKGFEEGDLDVFMGGTAFGSGIGAAYQRQIGLEGDEGPRAREDLESPKFKLD